jgi:hypothetical protein
VDQDSFQQATESASTPSDSFIGRVIGTLSAKCGGK